VLPGRGVHREHRRDRLRAGGGRCVQPSAGAGRCAVRPDRFLHGHLDRPGGRPGDVDAVSAALDPQHRSGVAAVRAHRHRAGPLTTALTGAHGSLTELSALVAGAAPGASSARAAADVALHDAWARDAELALVELLGGDADDHLESDMTISLEDPAVMATRAQQ